MLLAHYKAGGGAGEGGRHVGLGGGVLGVDHALGGSECDVSMHLGCLTISQDHEALGTLKRMLGELAACSQHLLPQTHTHIPHTHTRAAGRVLLRAELHPLVMLRTYADVC